jgi:hypothetical protein
MGRFQKWVIGAMMLSVSIFSSQGHAEEAKAGPAKKASLPTTPLTPEKATFYPMPAAMATMAKYMAPPG